ncbi:hypothetical protein BN903_130 [Halorubrum sp. AJ67]|nr:hypothetical protein BN903_130 [Halorubrum sp. AJ67]
MTGYRTGRTDTAAVPETVRDAWWFGPGENALETPVDRYDAVASVDTTTEAPAVRTSERRSPRFARRCVFRGPARFRSRDSRDSLRSSLSHYVPSLSYNFV